MHPPHQKYGIGAKTHSGCDGLGRVHTKGPGLIRSGRHNTPFYATPHNNRFSPQIRVIQNFHRRIKSVHVKMND